MKKHFLLAITLILITTAVQAQVSDNFSKQITALITTDFDKIKGETINDVNGLATYNSLLRLDDFKVSCIKYIAGNVLLADYIKPGSMEIMDNIYYSFLETPYTCKDSKDYPQMLKGITNSNLKRKIELIQIDLKNNTSKKMVVVEMDKENRIRIDFLNK